MMHVVIDRSVGARTGGNSALQKPDVTLMEWRTVLSSDNILARDALFVSVWCPCHTACLAKSSLDVVLLLEEKTPVFAHSEPA